MTKTITKEMKETIKVKKSIKTFNKFGLNFLENMKDYLPKEKIFDAEVRLEDCEKI